MAELSPDQVVRNWSAIASEYEQAFEGLSVPTLTVEACIGLGRA